MQRNAMAPALPVALRTRRMKIREALQRSSFLREFRTDGVVSSIQQSQKVGFLTKEGGSWKNWKRRFFVISQSEHLMYYSESPQNLACKGIIVLEDCDVREIKIRGGSRPFLFEIFRRDGRSHMSTNHRSFILQAASQEEMESWIDAIKKSIVNDDQSMKSQKKHMGRLFVTLHRAKSLQIDETSSKPFAMICIAGQDHPQHQRSCPMTSGKNPVWNEEYAFEIESNKSILHISFGDEAHISSKFLVYLDLNIEGIVASEITEQEFPLISHNELILDCGCAVLSVSYLDQSFLKETLITKYALLVEELLNPSADFLHMLANVVKRFLPSLGTALTKIFDSNKRIVPLLKWAVSTEVSSQVAKGNVYNLFAQSSLACHIFRHFFAQHGTTFLHEIIVPIFDDIQRHFHDPNSFELEDSESILPLEFNEIKYLCDSIISSITSNMDRCPGELREACSLIHFIVGQYIPQGGTIAVGKIVFNQFISALVSDPAGSNIYYGPIPPRYLRSLPLVSKIFESFTYEGHPTYQIYTEQINDYVMSMRPTVEAIFHEFAVVMVDSPKSPETSYEKSALVRELHLIHHLLLTHKAEIEAFCSSRNQSTQKPQTSPRKGTKQSPPAVRPNLSKRPSLVINSVEWSLGCVIPSCICKSFVGASHSNPLAKCSFCNHALSAHSGTNTQKSKQPHPHPLQPSSSHTPNSSQSSLHNTIPETHSSDFFLDINMLLQKLEL